MKRAGKRTLAWEKERAKLKVRFAALGITSCEARFPHECWRDNGLSFAHALKRRNLKPHQLGEVALLCLDAHNRVEAMPEAEMAKVIRGIILHRYRGILNPSCACGGREGKERKKTPEKKEPK